MILVSLGALILMATFGLLYAVTTDDNSETFLTRFFHGAMVTGFALLIFAAIFGGFSLILIGILQ